MSKRDAICEAALKLFAEKGIDVTTTREIAERAEAAEGTLYRHFDGKEDLAEWLYQRCACQLRETLRAAVSEAGGPSSRLKGLVRGVFDFHASNPASCTYLLSIQPPGDAESPAARAGAEDGPFSPEPLIVEVLEEGMEKGTFRDESAPLVAGWILATVQRTVVSLETGAFPMDEQEAIDRTVQAALRLAGAEPA